MNILPKKNWHVRKKENIARVRRDEAEAAEKEKENERRVKLAEQESRIAFMRSRARERDGNDASFDDVPPKEQPSKVEADIYTSAGNINFFKEAETGDSKTGTNKEHEIEKKEEKEAYEKKIGLLTYLGQDTLEAAGKTAWYVERECHTISKANEAEEEIGLKSKIKLDPLNEIMKHAGTKIYPKIEKMSNDINFPSLDKVLTTHKTKNLCRKDKKHKREKHKKRKRKHSNSSNTSETESKKKKKKKRRKISSSEEVSSDESEEEKKIQLAKLREERLKREARERKREERLLSGKDPNVEEKEKPKEDSVYTQKYNSQFNPQLAKQNKETEVAQPALQPGVKYWLS